MKFNLKTQNKSQSLSAWSFLQDRPKPGPKASKSSHFFLNLSGGALSPGRLAATYGHTFRVLMLKHLARTSCNSLHCIWECYSFFLCLGSPSPRRPGPGQTQPPLAQRTVQTPNKAALETQPFNRLYEAHRGPPIILQQVISHEEIHFSATQNRGRLKEKAGGWRKEVRPPATLSGQNRVF